MAKTAAQMAQSWQTAMAAPSTASNYKAGIAGTTVNPMAMAATPAAQALYAQRTAEAVSSGKMANALNATSVQTWKDNSMNVGAQRFTSGAQKASNKVQAHFQKWAPIYAQASAAAAAIPKDGTMATALAKVQAALQVTMAAAGKV